MRKLAILSFLLMNIFIVKSQNIIGTWSGSLNLGYSKLPLVLHITSDGINYTSTIDSPSQKAVDIPCDQTVFKNDSLYVKVSNLKLEIRGELRGDSIICEFVQRNNKHPLILKKKEISNYFNQEPNKPYPYQEEEILFKNDIDNVNLSGTLTLPNDASKKYPAIILINGSGPSDRNSEILGHKPFLVLADYFTRNGYAVLRYDKRGVGRSSGILSNASTFDFVKDVDSAIKYLLSRNDIQPDNIGLVGHSEGSNIAIICASENNNVNYIVLLSGGGSKGTEVLLYQHRKMWEFANLDPIIINIALKHLEKIYEASLNSKDVDFLYNQINKDLDFLYDNTLPKETKDAINREIYKTQYCEMLLSKWMQTFLILNPLDYLEKIKQPVFAISGEKDMQVYAQNNIHSIKHIIGNSKKQKSETKIYPNLNHLLQHCNTGNINEYGTIQETFSDEVMTDILRWINLISPMPK